MCFALNDQKMVNELSNYPNYVQKIMCNDINKRFPSLPILTRGSVHEFTAKDHLRRSSSTTTTDDDDENLAPGMFF